MSGKEKTSISVKVRTRDQLMSMRGYPFLSYDQIISKLIDENKCMRDMYGKGSCGREIKTNRIVDKF